MPPSMNPKLLAGLTSAVAIEVQQVTLEDLDPVRPVEVIGESGGHLGVAITEGDKHRGRRAPAEWLEDLQPHPANPSDERAEHRASFPHDESEPSLIHQA